MSDLPSWNDPELLAAGDSARVARYRRHQSWYRHEVLGVPPGPRPGAADRLVGNVIDPEAVEADPRLNFVNEAAYQAAVRRGHEVQEEGGTLEVGRLFHNLLSSMPMCFNLFGALEQDPGFLGILQGLIDADAAQVDRVVCEINPTESLGDRTAFDAMVEYRDASGDRRFVGIETKYTEPFSPRQYDTERYRSVSEESSWFHPGAAEALVGSTTNQLWRGLMLASLVEDETGATGRYLVVSTDDDTTARRATASVQEWLTDPDRIAFVPIETFVDAGRQSVHESTVAWAEAFARRYIPGDS